VLGALPKLVAPKWDVFISEQRGEHAESTVDSS